MRSIMRIQMKYIYLGIALLWYVFVFDGSWSEFFKTNDQKAYALFEQKEYSKAAKTFENSMCKGASFFKAGEFKKAKAVYATMTSREARYNLGNSELMLGAYDKAIEAYDMALKIDPDFTKAKENKALALARKKMKEVENDGKQGVGKLGADKIVFDNKENKGVDAVEEGVKESSVANNANWLDRIQTSPKAFLKNKFSYQYQMKESKDVK